MFCVDRLKARQLLDSDADMNARFAKLPESYQDFIYCQIDKHGEETDHEGWLRRLWQDFTWASDDYAHELVSILRWIFKSRP